MQAPQMTPKAWIKAIQSQNTMALSRAITLIESTSPHDQAFTLELFAELAHLLPNLKLGLRLGITGPPGAGKSTLIEQLGMYWLNQGRRVAVLAIDPSSAISGGSLLADKTRMNQLSAHPQAYVRPSPSGQNSTGVNLQVRALISLLELAQYEIIIIESVGVGQLESQLAHLVDYLALIQIPGAGDEWQAMKKGLTEHVDLICIHKADDPKDPTVIAAQSAMQQVATITRRASNLTITRPIIAVSSLKKYNIEHLATTITTAFSHRQTSGQLITQRHDQAYTWFQHECRRRIYQAMTHHPRFKAALNDFNPELHPIIAAHQATKPLLDHLNQL